MLRILRTATRSGQWWAPLVVPLLVCLAYVSLLVTVNEVERASEMAKISRGVYSDTFSPTLFMELLTVPASWRVTRSLPTYPRTFDAAAYRRVVDVRSERLLAVGLGQAGVAFLMLALLNGAISLQRRREAAASNRWAPGDR